MSGLYEAPRWFNFDGMRAMLTKEMMSMHVRWLLWLIGIVSCMGCAGVPAVGERPPAHVPARSVEDILRLVRDLAIKGECANDEFYSADMMRRLFGADVQARRLESDHMLRVSTHGFRHIVAGKKAARERAGSLDGVWFEARKQRKNPSSPVCTLAVDFHGDMRGRDFDSVVRVLGPDWYRDRDAETRRNVNCCLHAWNPKTMPSGRSMGNAIIIHPAGLTSLLLEFDGAGDLSSINTSWAQP